LPRSDKGAFPEIDIEASGYLRTGLIDDS